MGAGAYTEVSPGPLSRHTYSLPGNVGGGQKPRDSGGLTAFSVAESGEGLVARCQSSQPGGYPVASLFALSPGAAGRRPAAWHGHDVLADSVGTGSPIPANSATEPTDCSAANSSAGHDHTASRRRPLAGTGRKGSVDSRGMQSRHATDTAWTPAPKPAILVAAGATSPRPSAGDGVLPRQLPSPAAFLPDSPSTPSGPKNPAPPRDDDADSSHRKTQFTAKPPRFLTSADRQLQAPRAGDDRRRNGGAYAGNWHPIGQATTHFKSITCLEQD